jgi:hypothetical protein
VNEYLASKSNGAVLNLIPVYARQVENYAVLVKSETHVDIISRIPGRGGTFAWVMHRYWGANCGTDCWATSFDEVDWYVDNDYSHVFKTLDELRNFLKIPLEVDRNYLTEFANYWANPLDRTKHLTL